MIHVGYRLCVSGSIGNYSEQSKADADDLYGKSKLLGEVVEYDNAVTLRTSIIGRELATANSLVDWFLSQEGEIRDHKGHFLWFADQRTGRCCFKGGYTECWSDSGSIPCLGRTDFQLISFDLLPPNIKGYQDLARRSRSD